MGVCVTERKVLLKETDQKKIRLLGTGPKELSKNVPDSEGSDPRTLPEKDKEWSSTCIRTSRDVLKVVKMTIRDVSESLAVLLTCSLSSQSVGFRTLLSSTPPCSRHRKFLFL